MQVIGAFGLVVLAGSALGVELDPVVSFPSQLAAAASVGEAVAWDAQDGAKPAEAALAKSWLPLDFEIAGCDWNRLSAATTIGKRTVPFGSTARAMMSWSAALKHDSHTT